MVTRVGVSEQAGCSILDVLGFIEVVLYAVAVVKVGRNKGQMHFLGEIRLFE